MNSKADNIEDLLNADIGEIQKMATLDDKYATCFDEVLFKNEVIKKIVNSMKNRFRAAEWEYVLVEGLRKLLPEPIIVEHMGGKKEEEHGCDIMIRYPAILEGEYVVGIQLKDYEGQVNNYPVDQVRKIDSYFKDDLNVKVIDKIVMITGADNDDNGELEDYAKEHHVRVVFSKDFEKLLSDIANATLGRK